MLGAAAARPLKYVYVERRGARAREEYACRRPNVRLSTAVSIRHRYQITASGSFFQTILSTSTRRQFLKMCARDKVVVLARRASFRVIYFIDYRSAVRNHGI